jgi:hypothetical protein
MSGFAATRKQDWESKLRAMWNAGSHRNGDHRHREPMLPELVGRASLKFRAVPMLVEKQEEAQTRARPFRFAIGATVVAAILAAFSPAAPHFFPAAFPRDPEKQQALESCRRADPNFVRFLPGDRDTCYDRFAHLGSAPAGVQHPEFRQSTINSKHH